ncbi:ATP-grasp domain-containing protein [Sinorhizobium meliloti]|uniref:ATP-grasp domain-containing protein n=1 Tax=Rhizobium meliloti TaxID=382 RepID=UPI000FD5D290|nr:acetyl-CoA carboxylase biotin carboxylase subunit family protein [Sinorhizobium meliloti]MDW9534445.1 ATP-grasp domain-containing protein [Sinorhizobium meliloti]MDW9689442.1 ATP-grasp domain-containing protein [Sinorhizobium meliloti]MDX0135228.1 ATP-grasp domain-containing protein [Sinorhizobium meliloti]RVH18741.1 ATP-grasp domain-containing protein [Sinorhizobium meliloti]RVI68369.1 ATP-grasp domain-containing protein [Sinorhizobium meliloti]
MKKRALILIEGNVMGTGQRYVQAAERLDLHPITLSADPAQYNYILAEGSHAIRVDTGDLDALVRECSQLRAGYDIVGITCARESFYATAGRLSRHFELAGPDPLSVERCCDKFAQRQLLADAGVPVPIYRLAADATDVNDSVAQIGLPVVLKPAAGSGSTGVRLCRDVDEVAQHTAHLLGGKHIWRSPPEILVEEFAEGPYFSVNIMGNEVVGIAAGEFGPPPHFVYREYTFPAVLTDSEYQRVVDVSLSCLRALGLGWGPTSIELRWTKRGPVVIEVNPRLAGTPDPQLIKLAYGVDLITEHIKLAIGSECDLRKRHSQTAAARFLVPDRDGILDSIDGDTQAAAMAGVAEVKFYIKPKSAIVRKADWRDCIGHVIAASPTRAQSDEILQRAVDSIRWSITPFPDLNE